MINEGFFAGFAQQAPAPGFFCVAGCNKAQHDFVDPHTGGTHTGPGFGQQGNSAIGGRIAFIENHAGRATATDDGGNRGKIYDHSIAAGLQMGQGTIKDPAFSTQRGLHLKVPLLSNVGPVDHRPSAAFNVVDEDVKPAELVDDLTDQRRYFINLEQVGLNNQVLAAGIAEIFLQIFKLFFPVEIIQGNLYPLCCQGETDFFTQSFYGAQDQSDFAV